jgi:hypothetical protein
MRIALRWRALIAVFLAVPLVLVALQAALAQRGGFRPGPAPPRPAAPIRPVNPRPVQPVQPNVRQPGLSQPTAQRLVWVTVWSCSRCGHEVGQGGAAPTVGTCPGCGARFTPVSSRRQVPGSESTSGLWALGSFLLFGGSLNLAGAILTAVIVLIWVRRRRPAADGEPVHELGEEATCDGPARR